MRPRILLHAVTDHSLLEIRQTLQSMSSQEVVGIYLRLFSLRLRNGGAVEYLFCVISYAKSWGIDKIKIRAKMREMKKKPKRPPNCVENIHIWVRSEIPVSTEIDVSFSVFSPRRFPNIGFRFAGTK